MTMVRGVDPAIGNGNAELREALLELIVQHGLVETLRALAHVMGDLGCTTCGVVSEVAAVEAFLLPRLRP
jgi:hypothetical protein